MSGSCRGTGSVVLAVLAFVLVDLPGQPTADEGEVFAGQHGERDAGGVGAGRGCHRVVLVPDRALVVDLCVHVCCQPRGCPLPRMPRTGTLTGRRRVPRAATRSLAMLRRNTVSSTSFCGWSTRAAGGGAPDPRVLPLRSGAAATAAVRRRPCIWASARRAPASSARPGAPGRAARESSG